MIPMNPDGTPVPGDWYPLYTADWRRAFPTAPPLTAPGHYFGATWRTLTPEWDSWWFESHAAKPPTMLRHV